MAECGGDGKSRGAEPQYSQVPRRYHEFWLAIEIGATMESIGNDLRQMQRIPLTAVHVAALRAAGKIVHHPAGVYLSRPGEPVPIRADATGVARRETLRAQRRDDTDDACQNRT